MSTEQDNKWKCGDLVIVTKHDGTEEEGILMDIIYGYFEVMLPTKFKHVFFTRDCVRKLVESDIKD